MSTVQSRKAKGRRLQQYVVAKVLEKYTHLTARDVQSTSMGSGGVDVKLSQAAVNCFPWSVECKNREANALLYNAWKQAVDNSTKEAAPLLILGANRMPVLAVIDFDTFMSMQKNVKQ